MKKKYKIDIEKSFKVHTVLLIAMGVLINVLLPRAVIALNLPLYLDNIGSVIAAALGGPIPGMVTAFTSNYLGYFGEPSAIMFGVLTVTMAYLASLLSQHGLLRQKKGYFLLWSMMVLIGGAVGSIMGWYLYGETVGGTIAAPYVFYLVDLGVDGFCAQFLGDVFLDVIDKGITVLLVALFLHYFPKRLREVFPLSYVYGCSEEDLEKEYQKRKTPYTGISVFNKVMFIVSIALVILAVVVTCYSAGTYLSYQFSVNHDTYALFGYIVQLIGLEFVIIIFTVIISSWMTYETLTKPLNAIVSHSEQFSHSEQEKWLNTEQWKNRYVVKTKDEIQVLYDTICASEEMISQKVIRIRENESKLKKLSEIDLMTNVKNRGSGEKEIIHLLKEGKTGLFCLLDCDKFKKINDTYGHIVGDKVLIEIAEKLKKVCHPQDILLRLGGDEFAIYKCDIHDENKAMEFFHLLFDYIQDISVKEMANEKVSISLGASFYTGDVNITFDDLYRQADFALYESKKTAGSSANIYHKN